MKKFYINKQGDRMEVIPYKGSIPFNAVAYCTGLDQGNKEEADSNQFFQRSSYRAH